LLQDVQDALQFYTTTEVLEKTQFQGHTNGNESLHSVHHRRYAVGGKYQVCPRGAESQAYFTVLSVSTSHSDAQALVMSGLGMKDSPSYHSLIAKGKVEQSKKAKRAQKSGEKETKSNRKQRKRNKTKSHSDPTDYSPEVELAPGEVENRTETKKAQEGEHQRKRKRKGTNLVENPDKIRKKTRCSKCQEEGHNARTCKGQQNPTQK
jgi:hypothetical protein